MRGGEIIFDKSKVGKKIIFCIKKNKTTDVKITLEWSRNSQHSGAKVLLLKEGSASNTNINLCVAESDWTKKPFKHGKSKNICRLS